ncbi:hypothetical protein GX586_10115, partial [bacterium]|nr:hypothetical protein [bacterium]
HGYAVASGTVVEPVEDDAEDDEAEIEAKKIRAATGRDRSSITMRIFQRIVYAAGMPFRIITVPAIDACGKNAWDVMLARVLTAFHKSSMIDMPDDDEFEIAYKPPDGALGVLMNRLVPFLESNRQYRVTIIGHSLGALIGNELVRSYPALPCDDIVYMGAASTVRETAMTVMPFLRTHTNCTFYNLCLHQHADAKEYMWFMILPSGSILEWVDTFLSDPLTAEDLTVGKWKNAIRSLPSLEPGLRKRIVIKAFGIDDPIFNKPFAGMPEAHTDFSSPALRFWERSFWNLPPVWTNRTRAAHGGPTRLPH